MILKECFTDEFISSRAGINIEKKKIYEKVVHAFYLLEKLANTELYFVFKGGTSLMLLLKEFNRFSVDIDILMKEEMQNKIDEVVFSFKDEIFVDVVEDKRKPIDVIKRHFKFFYDSIYSSENGKPYVLLDIVFDNMEYTRLERLNIDSRFVKTDNPYQKVLVPTIDEMLGDKLTAFAPKTIGILYHRPNERFSKHIEIIKQLYDVSKLYDSMIDLDLVRKTYNEIALIQIKNRGLNITPKDTLKDTIEACIAIITQNKNNILSDDDYNQFKKGYEGFKHYTVNQFKQKELLTMTSKAYILAINVLYPEELVKEEKPINTFVGKQWKYLKQNIGVDLYSKLMKACFIFNKYSLKEEN